MINDLNNRGRPRQTNSKRKIKVVRLDSELEKEVDDYLYINKINFSQFARLAFKDYLKNSKNKND